MHSIQIHKVINQMISFLCLVGLWHREVEATAKDLKIKWFYSIYYLLFPISLAVGAINSDNKDDRIFLIEILVAAVVMTVKLWFLIWKQKQIQEMLDRICFFSVKSDDAVAFVNDKFGAFMKFIVVFFVAASVAHLSCIIPRYFGPDKVLYMKIAFPMNWKNDAIAFFIANSFLLSEIIISIMALTYSVILWYLLLNCVVRYEVLGNWLPKIGMLNKEYAGNDIKISDKEKHGAFIGDLAASIDTHAHIREITTELESFCSNLFFIQIVTSGISICGSVYCMAFDISENGMERIFHGVSLCYHISEIFMITYFGNEIMLASDRLSYCLFESDWVDQPQSTKKIIIIFGEFLKKPHQMVIGRLYPLTLETFTRILNSAYTMFNILKNIAH